MRPCLIVVLAGSASVMCQPATAQPAPLPYRIENHARPSSRTVIVPRPTTPGRALSFDVLRATPTEGPYATVETVERPDARWLQLQFSTFNLGRSSSLVVRSVEDGAEQSFTGEQLREWGGATVAFNGSAVQIELRVAPGETGIFYNVDQVVVGERLRTTGRASERVGQQRPDGISAPESICGASDDRRPSNDARVGRLMPVGCTGWIITGGIHLTAGHCVSPSMRLLQFNVPNSTPDGNPRQPPPEHQYAVRRIVSHDDGDGHEGDDWAVFSVARNSVTNRYPIQAQGAALALSQDARPTNVRVTGYGLDDGAANQVQQTHSGAFLGATEAGPNDVEISHRVDTRGGNSGGPILVLDGNGAETGTAIGIHTNAGCGPGQNQGSNSGTGFAHRVLWRAINDFEDRPDLSR